MIPYQEIPKKKLELPPLQKKKCYNPPLVSGAEVIPEKF